MGRQRAVFLDRDGVLNRAPIVERKPYSPSNLAELEVLPGVSEALETLHLAGFKLIVVTNQPNIKRGLTTVQDMDDIHHFLSQALPIDEFYTCLHIDEDQCDCRKPSPGMLLEAAKKYDIEMSTSFMIGDRWRDVEAGNNAGCKTIFIDYDYDEPQPQKADMRVGSLHEAMLLIMSGEA